MKTTVEILKAARDLIAKPANWTQGEYARGPDGTPFIEVVPEATCFCSIGAVAKVMGCPVLEADRSEAVRLLVEAAEASIPSELTIFNDESTHSEVLALFSKAISSAEEKQGEAS